MLIRVAEYHGRKTDGSIRVTEENLPSHIVTLLHKDYKYESEVYNPLLDFTNNSVKTRYIHSYGKSSKGVISLSDNLIFYKYSTGSLVILEFDTIIDATNFWSKHIKLPIYRLSDRPTLDGYLITLAYPVTDRIYKSTKHKYIWTPDGKEVQEDIIIESPLNVIYRVDYDFTSIGHPDRFCCTCVSHNQWRSLYGYKCRYEGENGNIIWDGIYGKQYWNSDIISLNQINKIIGREDSEILEGFELNRYTVDSNYYDSPKEYTIKQIGEQRYSKTLEKISKLVETYQQEVLCI